MKGFRGKASVSYNRLPNLERSREVVDIGKTLALL